MSINMVRTLDQDAEDVEHVANNESQVLLKRKPVHLLPPPTTVPEHAEVRKHIRQLFKGVF